MKLHFGVAVHAEVRRAAPAAQRQESAQQKGLAEDFLSGEGNRL